MEYKMFIKIFGIKIFKDNCENYINTHPLRVYGFGQFIIDQPIGINNQDTLLRFLENKYNLILIQKTSTRFIMRFKKSK
jgi:hypothetical protein